MAITRKRAAITAVVVAVVAAWAAISYATNTPPFKKPRGTIEAADLCPSFGDSQEAADILNRILPYAVSYRIPPEGTERRGPGPRDIYHTSSCSISGDGRLLLVRTELRGGEPRERWQERVLGATRTGGPKPFEAGRWAFTTSTRKTAAVYSACIPYGDSGLSTYIWLRDPAPADRLDDLRRLAVIAAEQAHRSAGCTVPANTPLGGQ